MVNLNTESPLLAELRSALQEILPPDWRWGLRVQNRPIDADAVLDLADPRGDTTGVRVELKSRLSPSEIVRQLHWYGERGPWLLAAPLVGPRTRQILADERISWIELTTRECSIAFGTLHIERGPARRGSVRVTGGGAVNVAGEATMPGRRSVADLFSGKALRIVRWLLIDPERKWTLDEMVSAANASAGFVSRTFATLERDAYMERERGASRLRDADGLLTTWATAPRPSDRIVSRVSLLATPQAILKAVGQLPNAPRYALTAEAAAEQIAPFARFSRIEFYVDEAGDWDRLLDLTAVPRGGNVDLILPADSGVFDGSVKSSDLSLVSRPQLYVDLKRRAGPASEAADFLRERGGAVAPLDARDDPQGVEAAQRVMLELWSVLGAYRETLTLVGGSAPPLLLGDIPGDPYVGTLDVDLIVDPLGIPDDTYRTIAEALRDQGYWQEPLPRQPFQWFREIEVNGRTITVEIDLLAPATTRTGASHRHEQIEGEPLARRTIGAELVREAYVEREVSGVLPDGRPNRVRLRLATVAVVVILKALAMADRDKPKDAYHLDYLLWHAEGGPDAVAAEIALLPQAEPIPRAIVILADKFHSIDAYGPTSVATYRRLPLKTSEADAAQAAAFARVQRLLERLRTEE